MGKDEEEEEWVLPSADAETEHEPRRATSALSALWTSRTTGTRAPAHYIPSRRSRGCRALRLNPAIRRISTEEAFGTIAIRREVECWVAVAGAQQEQLRQLMVSVVSQ